MGSPRRYPCPLWGQRQPQQQIARAGCLLQSLIFLALSWSLPHHGFPPSCPFLACLSPRPGHSSSASSSFLLTLCLQDFLSLIWGWGGKGGTGEGFLPSSSTSPSPAKPCCSQSYPYPELSTPVAALLLSSPAPKQDDPFCRQQLVVPSGPLKPLLFPGMGLWDVPSHSFPFPERMVSHFCH